MNVARISIGCSINQIDDAQISLKELVQDAGGDWVERSSALQLVEAKR